MVSSHTVAQTLDRVLAGPEWAKDIKPMQVAGEAPWVKGIDLGKVKVVPVWPGDTIHELIPRLVAAAKPGSPAAMWFVSPAVNGGLFVAEHGDTPRDIYKQWETVRDQMMGLGTDQQVAVSARLFPAWNAQVAKRF